MESSTWIRVSEVAHELGLSSQAVRNLIRSKELVGRKDDHGRWMVLATSARDYLDTHGRRRTADGYVAQLRRQVETLSELVEATGSDEAASSRRIRALERERDHYRSAASTSRESTLLLLASTEAVEDMALKAIDALRLQREALRQQLLPGAPEDAELANERGS